MENFNADGFSYLHHDDAGMDIVFLLDELVTTRRVLGIVTERAIAELGEQSGSTWAPGAAVDARQPFNQALWEPVW